MTDYDKIDGETAEAWQADALEKLRECSALGEEMGHIYADRVLIALLLKFGMNAAADEYENLQRWYS